MKSTKIIINPDYEYLTNFIYDIPSEAYQCDEVYKDNRNVVKKVTVGNTQLVVKRYKRPTLVNCFIYTFFRRSKAQRSYEYAFLLKDMDFNTARSIAYIEIEKNGFFHTGYYISEFLPYPLLESIEEYDYETKSGILADFVRFTIRQHETGILNKDYNSSNVFFYRGKNCWEFAIVDTNRIQFRGSVSYKDTVKQLKTISMPVVTVADIIERYANTQGWDAEHFCRAVFNKKAPTVGRRIKCYFKDLATI